MLLPNKVTNYKESILSLFPLALKPLRKKSLSPSDLYSEGEKQMTLSVFIDCLDCLFALGMVDFSEDGRDLRYVGRN